MNLNARAWRVCQDLDAMSQTLRIQRLSDVTGYDFGVQCTGGLHAGVQLARVCMADLASIQLVPHTLPGCGVAVQVTTDQPRLACMESQYAGWRIDHGGYFAMGSGPMRRAAALEPLLANRPAETTEIAVGVLEAGKLPPRDVAAHLAQQCRVAEDRICLLVAPTSSVAGTLQIVARSVETAMHKLMDLKFDLRRVASGYGVAPLPPVAAHDLQAIGWTNDAILYGGQVTLWVHGDDASLEEVVAQVPSNSSRDYGMPFQQIFARYDHDFYQIDPHLFSPASIRLMNLDTGHTFQAGAVNADLLADSFQS